MEPFGHMPSALQRSATYCESESVGFGWPVKHRVHYSFGKYDKPEGNPAGAVAFLQNLLN